MNIIWEQPNGVLAITTVLDGSDPADHAALLQERGDIPSEFKLVAVGYVGNFPTAQQETWEFVDGSIVISPSKARAALVPSSVTRFQANAALLQAGLLQDIENYMVLPSTDAFTRLAWREALTYNRASPLVVAIGALFDLSSEQLDDLFIFASTVEA